jgi:hypothetical protein
MQPVSTQRIRKHASTTTELLLETVFSIRPVQSVYKEENWGNQFHQCQLSRIEGVAWSAQRTHTAVYLGLYNKIMQATSRSHTKS